MSHFFRRLFDRLSVNNTEYEPESQCHVDKDLEDASENHKRASAELKSASIQQMEDAEWVRQIIDGVIGRSENRRPSHGSHH